MRGRKNRLRPAAQLAAKDVRVGAAKPQRKQARQSPPQRGASAAPKDPDTKLRPLLLAILFGQRGEGITNQCAAIARQAAQRGLDSLFLIDDAHRFADLRAHSLTFEYFPPPRLRRLASGTLQWDLYRRRRARLLYEKWRPTAVLPIGPDSHEFAAQFPQTQALPKAGAPRRFSWPGLRQLFQ